MRSQRCTSKPALKPELNVPPRHSFEAENCGSQTRPTKTRPANTPIATKNLIKPVDVERPISIVLISLSNGESPLGKIPHRSVFKFQDRAHDPKSTG
jgi:hypothetical protein